MDARDSVRSEPVDHFLLSREWRVVRMRALERQGAKCACCGRTAADGIIINVDHIKPRSRYPELALTESNLQVLCNECNHGKGNKYETDWRAPAPPVCPDCDRRLWVTARACPCGWKVGTPPTDWAVIGARRS